MSLENNPNLSGDRKRALRAALLGNMLEWFDFGVYSFVAIILAKKFFPAGDDVAALLATFGVFAAGFVIRPLGAVVIGKVGDKYGRKRALLMTISLMAVGTGMIGLSPTYESIGIAAPLILLAARLLQSFSVGGEFATAVAYIVEWAPQNRRGLYGSLQQTSTNVGLLLGSGMAAALSTLLSVDDMETWGWRVPFLIGALIGVVGLYMRRNIEDTPIFRQSVAVKEVQADTEEKNPWNLTLRAFGFCVIWNTMSFIFLFYMPTFTTLHADISRSEALWANAFGLFALAVFCPVMGSISDKIGRRPMLLTSSALFLCASYGVFIVLKGAGSFMFVASIQFMVGLAIAIYAGPAPAAMSEIFRTRSRSTYMSIGYALSATLFGGFAPFIATWLIKVTESPLSPAFFVMLAAGISFLTVLLALEETAHKPLR